MNRRWLAGFLIAITTGLGIPSSQAQAQLGWNAYGVGEFDTEDLVLVLGGISIAPSRTGWVPVGALQAFWLQYGTGATQTDVTSITPSIGLRNNFGTGSFTALVGYNFSSSDVRGVVAPAADIGDGVVNSLALDYWGTGNVYLQGLASYNYGADALWARGRAMFRLLGAGSGGSIMGGGEVAFLNADNFSSVQPGIVLGYNPGSGTAINVGIGRRLGDGNDATYFRAELSLSGR